jgi:hypothetical protein
MIAEFALTVALLMGQTIGTNEPIDYREAGSVHIQHRDDRLGGFYPWASGDIGQGYLLGQSVSDFATVAGGVGYSHSLGQRLKFRAEAGMAYPIHRSNHAIQQEVVYTYLVGRHESEFRPVPVSPTRPYDQDSYETTWHVDYGAYARVGLEFEAGKHLRVLMYYKYFQPKGLFEIWDEEAKANGGGWWQEYRTIDMSTIQLGIGWEF